MRPRLVLLTLLAVLLASMGATAASAANTWQNLDVRVVPMGTVEIDVEHELGFLMIPGNSETRSFGNSITAVTDSGWQVTVTGQDLQEYVQGDCYDWGCERNVIDGGNVISASNIMVRGGDLDWWDDAGAGFDAIIPGEGTLRDTADPYDYQVVTIETAHAAAYGSFGLDNPHPSVEVFVPDTAASGSYMTTLVYTIEALTP
jgi:hypothetical protein